MMTVAVYIAIYFASIYFLETNPTTSFIMLSVLTLHSIYLIFKAKWRLFITESNTRNYVAKLFYLIYDNPSHFDTEAEFYRKEIKSLRDRAEKTGNENMVVTYNKILAKMP